MDLSVQIIDNLRGHAATSVPVRLERLSGYRFRPFASGVTDEEGRHHWTGVPADENTVLRIVLESERYFGPDNTCCFPEIVSVVRPGSCDALAATVLASPFAYSVVFHVRAAHSAGHREPAPIGEL